MTGPDDTPPPLRHTPPEGSPMQTALPSPTSPPSSEALLAWLVQTHSLTGVIAERVARVQAETADRLAAILLKLGLFSEARLADELARYGNLPRLASAALPAEPLELPELNPNFLIAREIVPCRITETAIEVGCWDTLDDVAPAA